MNFYNISMLTAFVSILAIGAFVYSKNKDSNINRLFFIYCGILSMWVFGCFMESLIFSRKTALIWDKFLYTGCILTPTVYLHFIYVITNKKDKGIFIPISYLFAFVFLMFNYIPFLRQFFILDVVQKYTFRMIAVPGPIWFIFFLSFGLHIIYVFYILLSTYKKTEYSNKLRIKYLSIAYLVMFSAGLFYFLLLFDIPTPPIDPYLLVIYGLIMTYAIVRHQLMEIEVIIRRALVFASLFAAVYGVFAFFTFLTQDVLQGITGGNRWAALIPSIIIITLALKPLENFLVRITDRFLFQKKYDYRELLRTLSREVSTIMDLDKLTSRIVADLINIVRLEGCAILLFDKDKEAYKVVASRGLKDKGVTLKKEDPMASFLETTHTHIVKGKHIERMDDEGTIKEDMKKLNAEFILPLIIHDELIGVLSLGMKKSGEEYNQDDIAVLESLSGTASVAISNAQYVVSTMQLEAEAAQREKMAVIGTLAAGINHEICNPLGIARGQCEVFLLNQKEGFFKKRSKDEQIGEAMKIMEKVIKEADRATAVTKKLSSFAKPSKGEISEDVNIKDEINEVMALVGHELKLENIDVNINIPLHLPFVTCDRKQLQQVLFNIIRNAGQAIGEKGVIVINAEAQNSKIRIEIKDTGHGIPKDKLAEVFNPFYTTKEPGKGTGLGLFIVRQLVERNKGKISVDSEVGRGTVFALEFPVSERVRI